MNESKQKEQRKQIALENTLTTKEWTLGYLGVMLAIYLGLMLVVYLLNTSFSANIDTDTSTFLELTYPGSHIYILVVGVMTAIYFFPAYVKIGVTRKNAFLGTIGGAIGTPLVLILLSLILSIVIQAGLQLFGGQTEWATPLFETFMGSGTNLSQPTYDILYGRSIFSRLLQTIIVFLTAWISLILHYSVAWFVGAMFYANTYLKSFLSILLGLAFIGGSQFFLGEDNVGFTTQFPILNNSLFQWLSGLIITLIFIGITWYLLGKITRKMEVRL